MNESKNNTPFTNAFEALEINENKKATHALIVVSDGELLEFEIGTFDTLYQKAKNSFLNTIQYHHEDMFDTVKEKINNLDGDNPQDLSENDFGITYNYNNGMNPEVQFWNHLIGEYLYLKPLVR